VSLKSRIKAPFAAIITGERRALAQQRRAERRRVRRGEPHRVTWYHRADDPYSHLVAQVLPAFLAQYPVDLVGRTVGNASNDYVPYPVWLAAHAHRDCRELASYLNLEMPDTAPSNAATKAAQARLIAAEVSDDYLQIALDVGKALWGGEDLGTESPPAERLEENRAELQRGGYFRPGTLHYGGAWYWSIDRIELLEARLETLGVGNGSSLDWATPRFEVQPKAPLEFFFSIRSPYSYLAIDRVLDMADELTVDIELRPILPMVMRGLPMPRAKAMALVLDAAREARRKGIPYGRICDPLGRGVERVIAVLARAQAEGLGPAFLRSAMHGIWEEGIDVDSRRGLLRVAERAGLSAERVQEALGDSAWERWVEENRQELEGLGLWGVPSFRLGDYVTWGQDRIRMVRDRLRSDP
jgi:2-hydroxychromene-2-carboxylate isomerase